MNFDIDLRGEHRDSALLEDAICNVRTTRAPRGDPTGAEYHYGWPFSSLAARIEVIANANSRDATRCRAMGADDEHVRLLIVDRLFQFLGGSDIDS